jgi:excisionase family DNA binding protein
MERLLTVNETCERLRWGRSQVYQQIRRGTLPSVLLGRRSRRVRAHDLDEFIARYLDRRPGAA